MARKLILSGFMSALLLASVIAYSLPAFAQGPDSAGKPDIASAFGTIPGKDLIVHVWVVIPQGSDKNEIINNALANQGARPFDHSDFKLNGLVWDQFKNGASSDAIEFRYNPDNTPNSVSSFDKDNVNATLKTWNDVNNSSFAFELNPTPSEICPSLVKECPGPQEFDGKNDIGWVNIKQRNTLAVTWYGTSTDEGDIAWNTHSAINWSNDNTNDIDVQTVLLHEFGHALGLSHSETRNAIMYPSYQELIHTLYQDDICGIQKLYGTQDLTCNSTTTPVDGDTVTASITYKNQKKQLQIQVQLEDNFGEPVNAEVVISLDLDDELEGTGSASTGDDGSVTFVKRGAKSGCYTATIISVSDDRFDESPTYPPDGEDTICI